ILTSGNTPKVNEWRHEKALERTQKLRPDLLK
ncbi:MAG: tRNA (guanosine(37)-N1)-methyltransferase TrmD, partial [Flavobacteriaceae bacterium]